MSMHIQTAFLHALKRGKSVFSPELSDSIMLFVNSTVSLKQ